MIPVVIVVLLIMFDQFVKYMTLANLQTHSVTVIPHFIEFMYLENRGAAFGIMQGAFNILIPITVIVVAALAIYYKKIDNQFPNNYIKISLLLIIAGAIGNLIDRSFRHYVIDTFHFLFIDFPVFNMADIYVVTGSIILVITTLFFAKEK